MIHALRYGLVALALVAGGCAQAARPDDQLVASAASVRTAQEIGAQSVPRAALALQLAEDELQHARDLINNGDNEKARFQLLRSKADGDLALSLTQSARAIAEADAAREQLKSLAAPVSPQ